MLSRPKRKASQINHSPKKAKQHWIYNFADVVRLYNIHPNTLRNWVKQGLPNLRDGKKRLFRGEDLNAFHRKGRERRKFPCQPGELYCVRCKQPHSLLGRLVSFRWMKATAGLLDWKCPGCLGRNATHFKRSGYDRLVEAGVNFSSDIDD